MGRMCGTSDPGRGGTCPREFRERGVSWAVQPVFSNGGVGFGPPTLRVGRGCSAVPLAASDAIGRPPSSDLCAAVVREMASGFDDEEMLSGVRDDSECRRAVLLLTHYNLDLE